VAVEPMTFWHPCGLLGCARLFTVTVTVESNVDLAIFSFAHFPL
jgi:hypothetical protein